MKKYYLLLLLFFFFIGIKNATAQSYTRETAQQFTQWFNPNLTLKFHKNVGLNFDGQLRFCNFKESMQHQMRGSLEIYWKNFIFSPIGYVYTWNYRYGKQPSVFPTGEHRIWEQIAFSHKEGRVNFNHRLRIEQRLQGKAVQLPNDGYTEDGFVYSNRIRYRFLMNIPLNSKTMSAKTVYASLYDEVFMSFGKNVTYNLPDQNRAFAGIGYKFNDFGAITLGYLHQLIMKKNGLKAESNHTLYLGLIYTIDFTKFKKK